MAGHGMAEPPAGREQRAAGHSLLRAGGGAGLGLGAVLAVAICALGSHAAAQTAPPPAAQSAAGPLRLDQFTKPAQPAKAARKARPAKAARAQPRKPRASDDAAPAAASRGPAAAAIAAATGTAELFDRFGDDPVAPSARAFAPLSAEGAPPARIETLGVKVAPVAGSLRAMTAPPPATGPAATGAAPPLVDPGELNEIDRAAAPAAIAQAPAAAEAAPAPAPRVAAEGVPASTQPTAEATDVRAWSVPFILTLAGALAAASVGLVIFRRA